MIYADHKWCMTELSNQTKRQWAKYSPPRSPVGTHESRVHAASRGKARTCPPVFFCAPPSVGGFPYFFLPPVGAI